MMRVGGPWLPALHRLVDRLAGHELPRRPSAAPMARPWRWRRRPHSFPAATRSRQDGRPIVYGVRPEHLQFVDAGRGLDAEVVVVEPTGAETLVVTQVAGHDLHAIFRERGVVTWMRQELPLYGLSEIRRLKKSSKLKWLAYPCNNAQQGGKVRSRGNKSTTVWSGIIVGSNTLPSASNRNRGVSVQCRRLVHLGGASEADGLEKGGVAASCGRGCAGLPRKLRGTSGWRQAPGCEIDHHQISLGRLCST